MDITKLFAEADSGSLADASPVLWVIIGCEIGFWVLVLGGLAVRYLLRRPRLSKVILLLVPVLDVVLLVAVALDLHRGAEVTTIHRLAGIYLGLTVAFGHSLIGWADTRFAHWFADGPKPAKPPRSGKAAMAYELKSFGQWLVAAAVAGLVVLVLGVTVADPEQARALYGTFGMLGAVTVIWLLTGPVWTAFGRGDDDRPER